MAVSLKHAFTSNVADSGDPNLVQPSNWNAEHTLTAGADTLLGAISAGPVVEIPCTAAGRAILDDADAAAQRTTLGLGTGDSPTFTGLTLSGVGSFSAGTALLPSLTTSGDLNTGMWFPAADTVAWSTNGSERMRVDASGRLLIGASTAYGVQNYGGVGSTTSLQNHSATVAGSGQTQGNWSATATSTAQLLFAKSVSGTVGTRGAITASGTVLGSISFSGDDGTNFIPGAAIACLVDAAPSGDMPGRLLFLTTAVGAVTSTERMRINRLGNIGIGTTAPDALLSVNGVASFGDGAVGTPSIANFGDLNTGFWFPAADTIAASTAGAERLRVDANGNVVINTAAIATTATDGFLYVPSCAGTPTGTPTTFTGRVPIVVDTTNNKLYFYSGGQWRDAGP